MIALAHLSRRRPVLALLAWNAMAVALGAIGFGIENQRPPELDHDLAGGAAAHRRPAGCGLPARAEWA
jgi:hypothetical protein